MNHFQRLNNIALIFLVCFVATSCSKGKKDQADENSATESFKPPTTYAELMKLSDEDLSRIDIARSNLLCAEGLFGAEDLDVQSVLWQLDRWARVAEKAEKQYSSQFHRNPARYENSLAKFKAINLALTIKNDLKLGYNQHLVSSGVMSNIYSTAFFRDSKDLFLHGFTSENRAGSCASLPVLMVAIGRRLNYPLHLVSCKGHLFCRWDDGKESFNIETAIEGVDIKSDAHYYKWPHPTTPEEAKNESYMVNLTPRQELGVFASLRAMCFQENNDFEKAAEAYELALSAFPTSTLLKQYLYNVKSKQ